MRREVIIVTDGDHFAKRALEVAAKQIPAKVISQTAGNPTRLSGVEIVEYIRAAEFDPVIVMLDDNGNGNEAKGEEALQVLLAHPDIMVIGALAVASNTSAVRGVPVDFSIDCNGERVETGVNKHGVPIPRHLVFGDTVDALRNLKAPVIVGIGDIGKMGGKDAPEREAPITTTALRALMAAYEEWKAMRKAQSHDLS
ncbi:stage V sporulation protein AE [Alicyclobacillus contaminans]|uniref:stage V sporulation protein AE n=1 Tax=Alicyclobacillus contaminans TaxID=392016 RepID=UPI0003FD3948|nr:stage V sporulation protein AE [Alicyclobacillus contaminans]GMA52469.1 stage V sporulation protein AE [Alicyclobacillus contaminans]